MSVEDKDSVMMIGLHSVASLTTDGDLPALQALVSRRTDQWTSRNVAAFPRELARAPGAAQKFALGPAAESGANVIRFADKPARLPVQSRKT